MRSVLSPAETLGLSGATLEGRVRRAVHHVSDATFARLADRLRALPTSAVHCVWRATITSSKGEPTYTLYSRKLGGRDWPIIGGLIRTVNSVTIG